MKCKYCGEELDEGAKFCTYCGKPVEEEKQENIPEETVEETVIEETPVEETPVEEPVEEKEEPVVEAEVVTEQHEEPVKEEKKWKAPAVDLASFKGLLQYLKNPFGKADLQWPAAVTSGIAAIVVHTWLMRSLIHYVLHSLVSIYYPFFGQAAAQQTLLNQMGYTFGKFLTGGVLFTMVLFVAFLIMEFIKEEKSLDGITRSMSRAAGLLLVPTCLNALACIGLMVQFYVGAFFMALSFMTQILAINSRMSEKTNAYVRIIMLALVAIAILSTFGAMVLR